MYTNRHWVLAERPAIESDLDCFEFTETETDELTETEKQELEEAGVEV